MSDEELKNISDRLSHFEGRFDHHLTVYAKNGKELEAVKTNQAWLMRFFWAFMTPTLGGLAYIIINLPA